MSWPGSSPGDDFRGLLLREAQFPASLRGATATAAMQDSTEPAPNREHVAKLEDWRRVVIYCDRCGYVVTGTVAAAVVSGCRKES